MDYLAQNYPIREDIDFIASTGANTIRLPFNYKLFTDEDYMGLTANQDGFARVDNVVERWHRARFSFPLLAVPPGDRHFEMQRLRTVRP